MRKPGTLTRRDILKTFGMVGGSSLMIGAMDAWDLMGAPTPPKPRLSGQRPDTSVVILGAGLSGLIAGYELSKLGYQVQLLEARQWVGGLCWTVKRGDSHTEEGGETQICSFDEGQYFNAGAWRIPHRDEGIIGYCKELGVPLEIFINTSDHAYYYDENPELGELAGKRVRLKEVKADLWGATTELLAKATNQGTIDAPLSEEDKGRLLEFLVSAGYLDTEDYTYRPPPSRGPDEESHDLSLLLRSGFGRRVQSLYAATGGPDPVFQPIGGMQEIPKAFARELPDRIRFGAEVTSIRQTEDQVRVSFRDTTTGADHEVTGDYCICTLPMSILQKIDTALSPEMQGAVDASGHSDSGKMGLQMGRRFWEEDDGIYGGHLYAPGLELGEFSYPSNDYLSEKGVLLGYYGSGARAGLASLPIRDRIEHVLANASKVHPQIRDEFESGYCVWWEKVPYSMGAYHRTPPEDRLAQLSRADGRIYMGSAGASTRPAWLEGAVHAAWRTVESIHQRAMQE